MVHKDNHWKAHQLVPVHLYKSYDGYSIDLYKSEEENYKGYLGKRKKRWVNRWYNQPFQWFKSMVNEIKEVIRSLDGEELLGLLIIGPILLVGFLGLFLAYTFLVYLIIQILIGVPLAIIGRIKRRRFREILFEYFNWEPVMIEVEINRNRSTLTRLKQALSQKQRQFRQFRQQIEAHKNDKFEARYKEIINEKSMLFEDTIKWQEICISGLEENNSELHIRKAIWEADHHLRSYHRHRDKTDYGSKHELFLERLEDIQRWRSLSEELETLDITEGLKLELKDLEKRRKDWDRAR